MDKKETTRLRVQRYRNKQKALQDVTPSVTDKVKDVTPDVTQYPAILYALTDPIKREKLERICESLGRLRSEVFYGVSGPDFNTVGELLKATESH